MRKLGSSGRAGRPAMHAISLLLLAAHFLSLGHMLVVRHVTCAQHGDVVDSGHPREALYSQPVAAENGRHLAAIQGTAPQAEAAHDHCVVCSNTKERFALPSPDRQAGPRVEVALRIPSSFEPGPFAPIDLIALSPKNSPPTV